MLECVLPYMIEKQGTAVATTAEILTRLVHPRGRRKSA